MKARNLIKVLLSAALVFAATVDCSALFLNNLKGKLKEAVVEKLQGVFCMYTESVFITLQSKK